MHLHLLLVHGDRAAPYAPALKELLPGREQGLHSELEGFIRVVQWVSAHGEQDVLRSPIVQGKGIRTRL